MGGITDYGVSHVPVVSSFDDLLGAMGLSAADGVEWLLELLGVESPDAFDSLSDAGKAARIRKAETATGQVFWLIHDRLPSDATLRAASVGQPFVDEHGNLRAELTLRDVGAAACLGRHVDRGRLPGGCRLHPLRRRVLRGGRHALHDPGGPAVRAGRRAAAALAVSGIVGLLAVASRGCASDPLDAGQRSVVEALADDRPDRPDGAAAAAFVDDNLDVLLSAEVAGAADGAGLAGVFEDALTVEAGRDERLDAVAAAVATEGRIHSAELPVVFAEAIAENLDWVEARVNTALDLVPEVPDAPLSEYLAAHDLVREVVSRSAGGAVVREGFDDHMAAAISAGPTRGSTVSCGSPSWVGSACSSISQSATRIEARLCGTGTSTRWKKRSTPQPTASSRAIGRSWAGWRPTDT